MKILLAMLFALIDGNCFAGGIKENGSAYLILFLLLSLVSMILSRARIFSRKRIAIDDITTGLAAAAAVLVLAGYIICFDISLFTYIVGISATLSACLAAWAAVLNLRKFYGISVAVYYAFMLLIVISVFI